MICGNYSGVGERVDVFQSLSNGFRPLSLLVSQTERIPCPMDNHWNPRFE